MRGSLATMTGNTRDFKNTSVNWKPVSDRDCPVIDIYAGDFP